MFFCFAGEKDERSGEESVSVTEDWRGVKSVSVTEERGKEKPKLTTGLVVLFPIFTFSNFHALPLPLPLPLPVKGTIAGQVRRDPLLFLGREERRK